MLDSGVVEALDYACLNNFTYIGSSVSGDAAGAVVALVGRNEGGKTLSRSTVNAVLDELVVCFFDESHWMYTQLSGKLIPFATRVATMAIADANKKVMIQHERLLDSLISGLVLNDDNPRKGQDGADAMQEVCAGVLHELALFGPGAAALRSHNHAMDALRMLAEVGTKVSRERASGALFELDEEERSRHEAAAKPDDASGGSGRPPPHIMMSYNWDHQDAILRVVAWLQAHEYLVWVDTEQMKGSTVDTMALAVEGCALMLIGVSRAYKESSNCRMEAQYGMQKKKVLIPLLLVEGYEADGWLGLLLGTSVWYALYGATLATESAFEDRMGALSRELGSRGHADAVVTPDDSAAEDAEVEICQPQPARAATAAISLASAAPSHLRDWSSEELGSWLSDAMNLPSLADAAMAEGVDGATAGAMQNADWKELGASGLQAAKVVGALAKMVFVQAAE